MLRNKHKNLRMRVLKIPKMYWKLLKGLSYNKPSSLHVTHFEKDFRAINNPDSVFFHPDADILEFNERYSNGELQVMFDGLNFETYRDLQGLQRTVN